MDRQERIRRRAHEIWEREGKPHGRDQEHWMQATYEVAAEIAAEEHHQPDNAVDAAAISRVRRPPAAVKGKGRMARIEGNIAAAAAELAGIAANTVAAVAEEVIAPKPARRGRKEPGNPAAGAAERQPEAIAVRPARTRRKGAVPAPDDVETRGRAPRRGRGKPE